MKIKISVLLLVLSIFTACEREDIYDFMEGHTRPLMPEIKVTRSASALFNNDSFTVTMKAKTGAVIEYTINGSDPTPGGGTVYTGPFDITTAGNTQIKAIGHIDLDISEISSTYVTVGEGNAGSPYEIATAAQLNNIRAPYLIYEFIQTANIDLSAYSSGEGWMPIGTSGTPFAGNYNGNGYVITGLKINKPTVSGVGLFGEISGATLSNIALQGVNVTGSIDVGGLAGLVTNSNITKCYTTGSVNGTSQLTGGLIGNCLTSSVNESFSQAIVSGGQYTGGLIGRISDSTINQCYATGDVSSTITGNGGLVGEMGGTSNINESYSTGKVTGLAPSGGLLGSLSAGTVTKSVWNKITSNYTTSAGLMTSDGKTTEEMKIQTTYTGALMWNFGTTWTIQEGVSYPYFQWQGAANIPY